MGLLKKAENKFRHSEGLLRKAGILKIEKGSQPAEMPAMQESVKKKR